ncbi:hypothetical protein [Pseudonocardia humida]|uniref:Mce-associated membrane protein n=1 Tax=Pseudonocardia humida TaxID=2800819 RepID=A0ABT0ZXB5_9PSEU|nr:hypothetical protein [Pseudonocardia humida]MCO1655390.1 hypothetical protein [Pseudonocardia humida]
MPIRTPRGRSAAYRAIWQWPLRSPARLASVVVVVLLVAVGVTVGLGYLRGPEPATPLTSPTARPSAGANPSAGTPRSTPGTGPSSSAVSPLPLSQVPPEALDAAERWAKAWVRPDEGTPARVWLDGLRPLTTEEYLGVLSGVDPENIPATRVTGDPSPVRVAERNVQVEVPTDAVTLRVLVVDTESGWRVAGYDRV